MSRIYDAIQIARESRSSNGLDRRDFLGQMELPERRVNPRSEVEIELMVYGRSTSDGAFYEKAKAISGNANGGVFLLSVPIEDGQDLLLVNNNNSVEQLCSVVGVSIRDILSSEVSVSFPYPNQDFWSPSETARQG